MLVTQFTVHIQLQARAGSRRSSESQESGVRAPISQACLLKVHCMHFAIFPLVPHQHFVDLANNRGLQPSCVVLARVEAKEDTTLLWREAESGQEVDVPSSE